LHIEVLRGHGGGGGGGRWGGGGGGGPPHCFDGRGTRGGGSLGLGGRALLLELRLVHVRLGRLDGGGGLGGGLGGGGLRGRLGCRLGFGGLGGLG